MTIEIYKPDLKEFLDIAVEAKRAYWDANKDVELMFSDDKGNIPDKWQMPLKTLSAFWLRPMATSALRMLSTF